MKKVFAVGVGPGNPEYITEKIKKIIESSDIIVGYEYTLDTIRHLLDEKKVFTVTMNDQEKTYQEILKSFENGILVVPFTGDVNFSESEVVDRLIEIYGDVEIVPGISSIQIAASKAKIPLDKSRIITMHITTSIEEQKLELQKAILDGYSVILVPRPWPKEPKKHFMPSEISKYLKKSGFDTSKLKIHVFEKLTTKDETEFIGKLNEIENKEFSDLSVMVFNQTKLESYINFR